MSVYGKLYYGSNVNGEREVKPPANRFALFFHIVGAEWRSLVKLNLLFLLCCLPVVTVGAASSTMGYILKKIDEGEYIFLVSDFFRSFRENFKASSLYYLFYGGSLLAIILTVKYLDSLLAEVPVAAVLMCILMAAGVLVVFAGFYGFCMIGTMKLKWKDMFRNSFLFTIVGLKANALILLFLIPLGLLCYCAFPYSALFLIPLGASFPGLIIIHNVFPVMKKTIIK